MRPKYYHASPRRFRIGTVLLPGEKGAVFMTTSPVPHYTIFDEAIEDGWHVYQVEPIGEVWYGSLWDELTCHQAEVVRYVGKARGIARQAMKNRRGSQVFPQQVKKLPHRIRGVCRNFRWR